MQTLATLFLLFIVLVFPALCISRIAARMGRSGLWFGLLAALPLGLLVTLGLLALDSRKPEGHQLDRLKRGRPILSSELSYESR